MKSVYVAADSTGHVKIGVSVNPLHRVQQFSMKRGKVVPVYISPIMKDAIAVERTAQNMLSAARVIGEWFKITPKEAVSAVKEAARRIADGDRTLAKQPERRGSDDGRITINLPDDLAERIEQWMISQTPRVMQHAIAVRRLLGSGLDAQPKARDALAPPKPKRRVK